MLYETIFNLNEDLDVKKCKDHMNDDNKCKECMNGIHYGNGDKDMKTYECDTLISEYVASYLPAFIDNYLQILENEISTLDNENLRILSIGAGLSPDLMALEDFISSNSVVNFNIEYTAVDFNKQWAEFIDKTKEYCSDKSWVEYQFIKEDALTFLQDSSEEYDVIILGHVLSAIYNNATQKDLCDILKIIKSKVSTSGVIIINDVPLIETIATSPKSWNLNKKMKALVDGNKFKGFETRDNKFKSYDVIKSDSKYTYIRC